jgi:hypothetical protein
MTKYPRQHPRIKSLASRYRNFGAAIYAGMTFMVAIWENGERLEFQIKPKKKRC